MTASEVDLAIVRWTLVARDYKLCRTKWHQRPSARCKPSPPKGVYKFELLDKHINACTTDEC